MATISNGESGSSVRTKLNEIINKVEGVTSIDNDIKLGDNDKAIFGAGSDLQIYHTGSNSYFDEVGTGNLFIRAENLRLSNADNSQYYIIADNNGFVKLNYAGDTKLATTSTGVDVTGTITSDGLTVESNNNSTGAVATLSNTNTSTDSNTALGILVFESNDDSAGATNAEIKSMSAGTGGQAELFLRTGSAGILYDRIKVSYTGDISFYEDTGTTPKFFWDASVEALGINKTTSLGTAKLEVKGAGNTNSTNSIFVEDSDGAGVFTVRDNGEVFIKDSLGIGTSSPAQKLHLSGNMLFENNNEIRFKDSGGNQRTAISLASNDLNIGTSAGGNLKFYNGSSYTERMRIDSSGNLLIGGTGTPTSSAKNLVLYNGTAPTGNATDGVILYAEDVSSSSELKVRDEAGNVTTLSPHNFDLIPEGPSEDMAWSYYSERDGKRINVDMLKAIRLLEQISGEKLVHMV